MVLSSIPYISDRMPLALAIKIKVVLLMGKFESLTTVKRKSQDEFGKQTPSLNCIKDVFEPFTETGTVEDREGLRLLQKRQSKKFTMYVIMRENLLLKPYRGHFVQQLYEEDF